MFIHYLDLSWRSLKRTPLVSFLMILAIAIGIGVTMTSLSVYHMMSMDPIPSKSDSLYAVQLQIMDEGATWHSSDNLPYQLTYQDAENLANASLPTKKSPMVRTGFTVYLADSSIKPFIESARLATADFFTLFDIDFLYGAPWSLQQEADAVPVIVINESLNIQLFNGKNSLGKQVYLDDTPYEIVGVVKDWHITTKYYDVNNGAFNDPEQIFMPFSLLKAKELNNWGNTNGWKHESVRNFQDKIKSEKVWLQFWVQLNTPQEKTQYQDFLMAYMQEQQKLGRFNRKTLQYSLRDVNQWLEYNEVVSEDNKILVGLSFMFLAVCLANILGLLLAKFLRRAPEVGVRRALGASKQDVFLQHVVEVAFLGCLGGLLGIMLAQLGLWGVRESYGYYQSLAFMDWKMLLSAPIIAIATCVFTGLYPAWVVCKTPPAIYLKCQ